MYFCNESEEIFMAELKKDINKTLIVLNIFELFNLKRYQIAQSSNLQLNSGIKSIEKKKRKKQLYPIFMKRIMWIMSVKVYTVFNPL